MTKARAIHGLLAEFPDAQSLVTATARAHGTGYRRMDAYSPFPVEGLAEALGFRRTSLPLLVLVGGVLGGVGGYLLQYWTTVISYPVNVGGRPMHSWPAFIPVTFELTILGAALVAVLGMLALNGLPMPYHPVFNVPRFALATRDRFFLCIEANDRQFDLEKTARLLRDLGAREVTEVPLYATSYWNTKINMRNAFAMILLAVMGLSGCRQQMAQQPAYRPFRGSAFFADGRSARPLIPGTVARGSVLSSGKRPIDGEDWGRIAGTVGLASADPLVASLSTAGWSVYRDAFPKSITQAMLERGQERFNIYCAVCHDRVGSGKGMVVERGFTPPPSLHADWSRGFKLKGANVKLKDAPVGYFFEVITHGFGAMPDYADQIAPDDRWAIIAYVRALQLSQHALLVDMPKGVSP